MDFKVYIIVEVPIIEKKFEMLVPIDRRIHDIITSIKKSNSLLSSGFYEQRNPALFSKTTGEMYDMNQVIKDSNIRVGTRLILI